MSEFQKPYSRKALDNYDSMNWYDDVPCKGDFVMLCIKKECKFLINEVCRHDKMKEYTDFLLAPCPHKINGQCAFDEKICDDCSE